MFCSVCKKMHPRTFNCYHSQVNCIKYANRRGYADNQLLKVYPVTVTVTGSMCMCFCLLSVPKDLANRRTDMVIYCNKASGKVYNYFWVKTKHSTPFRGLGSQRCNQSQLTRCNYITARGIHLICHQPIPPSLVIIGLYTSRNLIFNI